MLYDIYCNEAQLIVFKSVTIIYLFISKYIRYKTVLQELANY